MIGCLVISILFIIALDWLRDPLNRYKLLDDVFCCVPLDKWSKLDNIQEENVHKLNFLQSEDDFKRVLFDAVKSNHDKIFRIALEKETEKVISLKDENKNSLCHIAAQNGNINVVKLLQSKARRMLTEKEDFELTDIPTSMSLFAQTNQNGNNCLHLAASAGQFECFIEILKQAKSDPELHAANNHGFYPLAFLIQHESNHTINLFNPWTPIFQLYQKVTSSNIDVANKTTGDSLLHVAVKFKNILAQKALLNELINANPPNNKGITPLHLCASHGRQAAAKLILESNNTPVIDQNGQTPFHYVGKFSGSVETFLALKPKKSDLEVLDSFGKVPMDYAKEKGFSRLESKMIEIIEDHMDNI